MSSLGRDGGREGMGRERGMEGMGRERGSWRKVVRISRRKEKTYIHTYAVLSVTFFHILCCLQCYVHSYYLKCNIPPHPLSSMLHPYLCFVVEGLRYMYAKSHPQTCFQKGYIYTHGGNFNTLGLTNTHAVPFAASPHMLLNINERGASRRLPK